MHRLNVRLLIILLVGVVVGGGAIHGLHAFQVRRQSGAFLREVDRNEKEGNTQEAIAFLRKYRLLAPHDTEAMARLGKLLIDERGYIEAQTVYRELLQQEPKNDDARRRLTDASLQLGRFQDALYQLNDFLLKKYPSDGELWLQFGQCEQGLGHYVPAAASYSVAIQKNPHSIAAYRELATILGDRPQLLTSLAQIFSDPPEIPPDESFTKPLQACLTDPAFKTTAAQLKELNDSTTVRSPAVALLDLMVDRNEANYEAYLTRGQFIGNHINDPLVRAEILGSGAAATDRKAVISKAFEDAQQALKRAPAESRVLLFAAQMALASESFKQAREWAQKASDLAPENSASYLILASVDMREKRTREAIEVLARGATATNDAPVLLWTLADLRIDAKEFTEAKNLVDRLEKKAEWARPIGQYLRARVAILADANWAEAGRMLETAGPDLKTWPQYQSAQFWRAQCYRQQGRDDLAVGAYRAALEVDSRWAAGRLALVESLRALGRIDEAIVELRQVKNLRNPPLPPQAAISYLRLEVVQNLSKPSNERDWGPIEKDLKDLSDIIKQDSPADPALLAAEVEVAKGKIDDAQRRLGRATDEHPKEPSLWSARISLASRRKDWNESERLLGEMRNRVGDDASFRLSKADYLVRRFPRIDGAIGEGIVGILCAARKRDLRALADAPSTYSAADRLKLAEGLARAAAAIQDYEQAERLLRTVAESNPANLQIAVQLFDLALQTGKLEAVEKALEKVEAIESGATSQQDQATGRHLGPISLYGEALRLVLRARQEHNDSLFDQALEKLAEARTRRPGWSRVAALIAEIHDSRGKTDEALDSYVEAIRERDRDPRVIGKTLKLLSDKQDFARTESVIGEILDEKLPFSMELTRVASEASVRTGDFERGLELAKKAAAESKDVKDHVWLATVLQLSNKASEAESEFRKVRDAARKDTGAWIALIQFYAMTRKAELAQKTLEEFLEAQPKLDPKPTPQAVAFAYQLVGRMKEAEAAYDAGVKAAPDDFKALQAAINFKLQLGRASEAESRLREVLTSRAKSASAETLAWARRALAISLAIHGSFASHVEAEKLIDKNLRETPSSDADLRAQAIVCASFPSGASRSKALKSFAQLEQRPGALTSDDRIVYAQLLAAARDWKKSSEVFRDVVTQSKEPRHVAHVVAYVDALLNQSKWDDAVDWVNRLEELAPNDFTTADLHARALVGQKQYDKAFDRLVTAVRDPSSQLAALARRRLASVRLESIGEELTRQKRDKEARRFFAQAEAYLSATPGRGDWESSSLRLQFLIRRHRSAEALEEFDRLCAGAFPDRIDEACKACASLAIEDRKLLEGLEQSIGRIAQQSPTPAVWVSLAAIQDRMGKYDDEEKSLRRALALDGNRIEALNNLAYILSVRKKDLPDARLLVQKAISQAGPLAAILDSQALVELMSGQLESAQEHSKLAAADDPSATHWFHLAEAQFLGGNRRDARDSWRKAIDAGLSVGSLHPLEIGSFQELQAQLEPNRG
jgi:tetratricopeptide (TPR) repeat protein